MNKNKIHTISIRTIIGAIMLIVIGISFIILPKSFSAGRENWIQTTGTILRFEQETHGGKKSTYTIVGYHVEPEGDIEGRGDIYTTSYHVNDKIQIKYNPLNHKEFTMDISNKMTIPFIVVGSILIVVAVGMTASEIIKGTSAKKQLLTNNSELNLNYMPSFMLEYVPLKAENEKSYMFKQQIKDCNNYDVTDSKGKVIFFTKRIKKGFTSSATYQLIDSATKQTTIINIKKSSNAGKHTKGGLNIKVNNLPIDKYFENRHLTYNISKEGNETKYTLLNNGSTLGFIYAQNSQTKKFEIETAKENIDDLSLFALCLTFR